MKLTLMFSICTLFLTLGSAHADDMLTVKCSGGPGYKTNSFTVDNIRMSRVYYAEVDGVASKLDDGYYFRVYAQTDSSRDPEDLASMTTKDRYGMCFISAPGKIALYCQGGKEPEAVFPDARIMSTQLSYEGPIYYRVALRKQEGDDLSEIGDAVSFGKRVCWLSAI